MLSSITQVFHWYKQGTEANADNQICSFIIEAEKLANKHFDISWGKKIVTSIEQINSTEN